MVYLLDANVFIESKNRHYGFDFCPAFWDWIDKKNSEGTIFSIDKIGNELEVGDDSLAIWAKDRRSSFFLKTDSSLQPAFSRISSWVSSENYKEVALTTFFDAADYYLLAYALAHQHTVVTMEIAANSAKRIKIPNVCKGVSINYVSPFQMLRKERARFVLGNGRGY